MIIINLTGDISINTSANELIMEKNGQKETVKLENQLMAILALLFRFEGQIVEKEIFIREIWQENRLTGEKALTRNIFKLREILKEHHISTVEIETIPKKGYRLLLKKNGEQAHKHKWNLKALIAVLLVTVLLMAYFIFIKEKKADQPEPALRVIDKGDLGRDTVIQLGDKPVQVIRLDSIAAE